MSLLFILPHSRAAASESALVRRLNSVELLMARDQLQPGLPPLELTTADLTPAAATRIIQTALLLLYEFPENEDASRIAEELSFDYFEIFNRLNWQDRRNLQLHFIFYARTSIIGSTQTNTYGIWKSFPVLGFIFPDENRFRFTLNILKKMIENDGLNPSTVPLIEELAESLNFRAHQAGFRLSSTGANTLFSRVRYELLQLEKSIHQSVKCELVI